MKNNITNNPVRAMMKPIPVSEDSRRELRLRQEAQVLNFLNTCDNSVTAYDVNERCHNIPRVNEGERWPGTYSTRRVSAVLRRLEAKGQIISTLYSGKRYYSVPVGGVQ